MLTARARNSSVAASSPRPAVPHLHQQQGPAEGSDHLFLLPQRVLGMDSTHLRQDLAALDFNLHFNLLHSAAPRGNVWLCEFIESQEIFNHNAPSTPNTILDNIDNIISHPINGADSHF
ncbi:hypothetical protein QAD02_006992 [Eretmocerus hayati]|uniref:Uncharacterized protein n=1 Tax=Eretmocerus hayati TaxID=131215 RepID=A0ACC2N2D0_9HYME|nr:hypothetical protein QAD02_006992 [Eretmocerus hayati]